MEINELLLGVDCECGKHHTCDIKKVYIEHGATARLTELCGGYNNILLVADENTYRAAGERTEKYISDKNIKSVIFSGDTVLIPDERAIARVRDALGESDLIIGIGSGVIQDLCKYISFVSNIPYFVVATAPSMDGYASIGAAMIIDGMKVSYPAVLPETILADTEVLKDAPIEMIKAGYGDIVGKYSALNDWKLSRIVNGEYFCEYVHNLTFDMVRKTISLADGLLARNEEAVKVLMEALVTVGIAMSFIGYSRPASGSEHHLSHYFEITAIVDKGSHLPHGIDVAFSTVVTAAIREELLKTDFSRDGYTTDRAFYESEMKRVYKSVAEGCIALQDKVGNYKTDRLSVYREKETEIKNLLREMPSSAEIKRILSAVELDTEQFYNTYGKEKIADAVRYAKDLKDRYTVLWLYYDLFGTETL